MPDIFHSTDVNPKRAKNTDGYGGSLQNVKSISISIASPEDIRSWSFGEVTRSETISYRTHKPEPDGLCSTRIFGPVKDFECLCGKYRRRKYKGITCEKCGVDVCLSSVRRERLGHIELVTPVAHTIYFRRTNSPIATLLKMTVADLEKVLYFESYMVLDPGNTVLKHCQVLSESAYRQALEKFGSSFQVGSGGEVIRKALQNLDLVNEEATVREQLKETKSETKQRALLKRLRLIHDFINSGNKPEWMILECMPVLPADLRPLVQLDGGRFVSSDLNELYKRFLNRNERLQRVIAAKAPDIIIRNEKRLLQEAADSLLDNSKNGSSKSTSGRPLKSLMDALKGKYGRFRQNLLGKRVDYSGRSVIIVGPSLKLNECGLPKVMAIELFKPFIFSKLLLYGMASSVRMAKKMVEKQGPEVWDVLEEVVKDHPVLLNRAPTLHRLNIQAFMPKLIESKAIQLHPLVCKAFNADFDGDQMAVHIPLSIEAQTEAFVLMLSSNNVKSPQNGQPVHMPTKDIVVGMYYMTATVKDDEKRGKTFGSYEDAMAACDNNAININTLFHYRYKYNNDSTIHTVETTLGRIMIHRILPQDGRIPFETFNVTVTSKNIGELMSLVYDVYGQREMVVFADAIKELGFEYSTLSGLSFGKDDMVVPKSKQAHIKAAMDSIRIAERQYADGYITFREKYNQVTDRWAECADRVGADMMKELEKTKDTKNVNSCYVMSVSGARANKSVLYQLGAMRGLIATSSGKVIDTPIISNFKEGMSVIEYFNSSHGSRKGNVDTALKTADAGYLTRRLVDVAQDCVVTEHDCGVTEGITYTLEMENGKIVKPLSKMAMGRVLCEQICAQDQTVVLDRGGMITEKNAGMIDSSGAVKIKVRSPVQCKAQDGICSACYGRDPSTGKLVDQGEVVGILAAQSIGEPGCQLTLRTFHVGGAVARDVEKPITSSSCAGIAKFHDIQTVVNTNGEKMVISGNGCIAIMDKLDRELVKYSIAYGSKILISDGDEISIGSQLAERDPYNNYIISEYDGYVKLEDFVPGISFKEKADEEVGKSKKVIVDWSQIEKSLSPRIMIVDKDGTPLHNKRTDGLAKYILCVDSIVSLNNGDQIRKGDIIARVPREGAQFVKDITGGLPRVEDIFEARIPKNPAIIAEIDGTVSFSNEYRLKNHVIVRANDGSNKEVRHAVPKGKYMRVQEGSVVKKGDFIVDGRLDPHNILAVRGIDELTSYIKDEVQQVYRLQGVDIDDKHIEIIINYMLRRVEIVDRGDSGFVNMQQFDIRDVERENAALIVSGQRPAVYIRVLQGITRASIKNSSFISAASFQETTRVLMDAAISHRKDPLTGMKENVIIGGLVPGGTGFSVRTMKKIASMAVEQEVKQA